MTTTRIAVYGTLRRNNGNHTLLANDGVSFVGKGTCMVSGKMYSNGGFPILSFKEEQANPVVEVYDVDEKTMLRVDRLEGYVSPEDHWYNRTAVPVLLDNGTETEAWIYHQDKSLDLPVIESGDWEQRPRVSARW